jgi:magnesium-transporting ATPase (P-type)
MTEVTADTAPTVEAPHALPADAVASAFGSSLEGLSAAEAAERLKRYGPNRIAAAKGRSWIATLAAQFNDVLIYALFAAAATTLILGHITDSLVILAVVVINAAIGFVQERRAEQALRSIQDLLAEYATVVRSGRSISAPVEDVVPGDVVRLEAGAKVPADLRLMRGVALQIQEAVLTGESGAVDKSTEPVAATAVLGDRTSMAFAGTIVAHGSGTGVVTATGGQTELGRINALLGRVDAPQTPLTRQLARFGRSVTVFILIASVAAFAFGYFLRGMAAADLFLAVVGIAVAAIPEGLPAIVTIALAVGMRRMARRKAIVRYLAAVETLGAVGVICSDKTGTFTRNEMMAETVVTGAGAYAVTGSGYAPEGTISRADGAAASTDAGLRRLARAIHHCNDAALRQTADGWQPVGDPMEAALVALAIKAGDGEQDAAHQRPAEIPFDATQRFMATAADGEGETTAIHVKGAPEQVFAMCGDVLTAGGPTAIDREAWEATVAAMAGRGLRVIAVADMTMPRRVSTLGAADIAGKLTLLGLVGLIDPPRAEAIGAVAACRSAGIRVKMITGDHAGTATAIAARLGLAAPDSALTGSDLALLDDLQLAAAVERVDVFARTSPEDKLRLVQALQSRGAVVAMTGDGVNDAPALKRADIGVAMGLRGSAAAREVAKIVLADDNFATIAAAVEEGRHVYDNIKKAVAFILPTNGGEAFAILGAILFGVTAPISPLHILWINLVTEVTLSLAVAFEGAERDLMRRPPRAPGQPLLAGSIIWRIAFITTLMVAGTFGIFALLRANGAELDYARTAAVNAIVAFEAAYLISIRRLDGPGWSGLFSGGARAIWTALAIVALAQLAFTYLPLANDAFATAPLDIATWLLIVAAGVALFLASEAEKSIRHRLEARSATP